MIKKYICGVAIGAMLLSGLTACGSKTASGENVLVYEDESAEAPESETLMAMVQSIDGNEVTVSVGGGGRGMGRPGGDRPDGTEMPEDMTPPEGGERPEGMEPPEGGESPEGMTPPEGGEMPEGMEPPEGMQPLEPGEMPEGTEMPRGGRGGRGGQSAVLTIGDESVISVSEASGSLSDIQEGSMLMITFDDAGKITEISVMERRERPGNSNGADSTEGSL